MVTILQQFIQVILDNCKLLLDITSQNENTFEKKYVLQDHIPRVTVKLFQ